MQKKNEFEDCVHCHTEIVKEYFITHLVRCLLEAVKPTLKSLVKK